MMNFYNSKEVVAMLSAPPFSFNRPGTVQVEVYGMDAVKLIGEGSIVEDAIRSLTDGKSSHARYFARHKTFFQANPLIKEGVCFTAVLQIGSRRKW